jgi:hypothetical protein
MPELPIESGFLPKLKERLALAKEIEKAQHVVKKENHDKNWLKEAAEAMDVDIDPSLYACLPRIMTCTNNQIVRSGRYRSPFPYQGQTIFETNRQSRGSQGGIEGSPQRTIGREGSIRQIPNIRE